MQKEFSVKYDVIASYEKLDETEKKLYNKAAEARSKAYAVYSNFTVGCAVLLENGEITTGSNQENAAYPSGLCAERTAVFWTSANFPGVTIKKIFVIGAPKNAETSTAIPPCGACRQAILEYESWQNEPIEIYFAAIGGEILKAASVRELLPFSFDSAYLE